MDRPSFPLLVAYCLAVLAMCVSGCRHDGGDAFPSPSPSPTASPTPTVSPSAFSRLEMKRDRRAAGPEVRVVEGNADVLYAAGKDALDQMVLLESFLNGLAVSQDPNASGMREAVAISQRAFLQAEAGVYYYDLAPGWAAALGSFGGSSSAAISGYEEVSRSLEAYVALPPSAPEREASLAALRGATGALRASLERFVADWDPAVPDNYRAQTFVADPNLGVGKILQGLLALNDGLIVDQAGGGAADRLVGRLDGMRAVYTGRYDSLRFQTVWTDGLSVLVQQNDPKLTLRLEEKITELLAAWKAGDFQEGDSARLSKLRSELVKTAEVLGYSVEDPKSP